MKYLVLYITWILLICINTVFSTVSISAKYENSTSKSINFGTKQRIELICNVSSTDNVEVEWEKNEINVASIKELKNRIKMTNKDSIFKLTIEHAVDDDAGNYSCIAKHNGNRVSAAHIAATSRIAVKVPSNINVVEGEKLRIHCNVIGKPFPKIHWFYKNDTYNETYYESDDRVILEDDNEKDLENAILKIEEIQMYDRGEFQCIGVSEVSGLTDISNCMIRVKDKYAALWPFLGICAEVFILCAIIFIYEKKRNKSELEESDTDQSPDQKNTPDHGKDSNLRHRQ